MQPGNTQPKDETPTPRTDAVAVVVGPHGQRIPTDTVPADFARTLERELATTKDEWTECARQWRAAWHDEFTRRTKLQEELAEEHEKLINWMAKTSDWCHRHKAEKAELECQLAAATARAEEAEKTRDDLRLVLDSRRDQRFVNATPDDDLPVRILQAYVDQGAAESEPPELGLLMNQWQRDRNIILWKAIGVLHAARATPAKDAQGRAEG